VATLELVVDAGGIVRAEADYARLHGWVGFGATAATSGGATAFGWTK